MANLYNSLTWTSNSAKTDNSTHPQIFMKTTSFNFKNLNTHNASHYYILYFELYILYYTILYVCVDLKLDF